MKTVRTILIISLLGALLGAQDALSGYLKTAAENNPDLKARFSEYMAAMEQLPQVGALPDPQLVFAYFVKPVETRNGPQQARVSLTQMFPWFGTLKARKQLAEQMAQAQYEQLEAAKSALFFEVKSTYLDLYMLKKGIDKTQETLHILETFHNLALIRINSGSGSAVDAIKAEMELAEMENTRALLTDQLKVTSVRFNTLLNVDADRLIDLSDTLWTSTLTQTKQDLTDQIRRKNHQLLSLNHMEQAYRSKGDLARRSGMPSISLGFDYMVIGKADNAMTDQNGRDAIVFPMLGMTIPLQRGKYRALIKEAAYLEEAAAYKKLDKANTLNFMLERVLSQYNDAVRRMVLFEKQLKLTGKALGIMEIDYSTHGKNFEDILQMTSRQLKYALELDKAKADKLASLAFIDLLLGQ